MPDRTPPTSFSTTGNAGDVAPETSFGFDFGADRRFLGSNIVSLDAYQTTLRNQFLSTEALTGTYTAPPGNPYGAMGSYPLYTTQTRNLGHSLYEGLELSVHRDPIRGAGYRVQGYLQRAYAYALPAGFYDTASGVNTANLGILPGENFQTTGQGYNGLSQSRVPYSGGYAEYNYRWRNDSYFFADVGGGKRGVTFKMLWKSWASSFGKKYDITDATVADKIRNNGITVFARSAVKNVTPKPGVDYDLDAHAPHR